MKRLFIFLGILLCVNLLLVLTSCNTSDSSTSATQSPQDSSGPVKELLKAIRYNPDEYAQKQVTIVGTVLEKDGQILVFDLPEEAISSVCSEEGVFARHNARQYADNGSININFADTVEFTAILQTGDYIELSGIVEIRSDEICLINCEYTMLKVREDRVGSIYEA